MGSCSHVHVYSCGCCGAGSDGLRLHVPRGPKPARLPVSYVDTFVLRGHDAYVACPTWTVLSGRWPTWSPLHWPTRSSPYVGKSPTWTLTYVVTSPLTYEVKPLRGEKSYVDVDLRGHLSIDLRGQAPTWGKVLRGRWPTWSLLHWPILSGRGLL